MKGRSLSKKTTYSSLSNLETENISDDNDDTRTLTSRHSIHSSSKRSKSRSSKRHSSKKRLQQEQKEKSRSDDIHDNASKSSKTSIKSLSVKTFYRNRRSRHKKQKQVQDPYFDSNTNIMIGQRPLSGKSKSSKNKSENSLIDTSGNWRCNQCTYFPNTRYDPHCYKCGAMKDDPQHLNIKQLKKPRKRTVSSTGTTSSSPILAPGSIPQHSSNLSHQIIHSSDNNTTTDNTTTTTDDDNYDNYDDDDVDASNNNHSLSSSSSTSCSSSSEDDDDDDSSTNMTSKQTISNVKAIVVEDNRSKTSKTSKSNSRHAIGQPMDFDEDLDVIPGDIALPQKKRKSFDGNDNNDDDDDDEEDANGDNDDDDEDEDEDEDDDDESTNSSDGDIMTEMPHSHLRRRRSSTSTKLNNFIDKFGWNGHNTKKMKKLPKAREWQTFQFYLGFKRFILAILYFIVALEEIFVLVYVKWWLPLPLILCITYLLLISCDFNKKCGASFNKIKHDQRIRTLILIAFYFMNVMIIIAPPMNALIASSNVYDYRDLLDRDMIYNHLMWIFFSFSIISMVFIDIIIVHDDDTINDKYRVETFKLAIVKDEEYVLNNQCLWYSVPRKDWGKIDKKLNKKKKYKKRSSPSSSKSSYTLDGLHSNHDTKQNNNNANTKSFFVRIGLGKDDDDDNDHNHNKTISDHDQEDESTSYDDDDDDYDDDDDDDDDENGNDVDVEKIGNKNMKNRSHINTDNEFDDDRQSMHSMTNIINNNSDSKISRCCTAPFSALQWVLTFTFFISLQLCVVFAIFETFEIEKHDISVPVPPK